MYDGRRKMKIDTKVVVFYLFLSIFAEDMNKDEIKQLLLKGERVTLEAKLAEKELPKSIWETYSAFANTVGGTILLGVEEHRKEKEPAKRFEIHGVEDADKIKKDFWNTINSNKVSQNILTDDHVDVVDFDGKMIVSIQVPQANFHDKPIYLNENVNKNTFRRDYEGDHHCTLKQIKAMIRDSYDEGNDGQLMEKYDMRDIDLDSLHRYRTLFKFKNEGHIWNEVDDLTFLKNLGGCVVDRETGKETLTMAGLMMFGTGLAVRERFANFRMDYINMCNLIGDERYSDRLTYDGRWENNLYQFFSIVLPKMTFDLPRPFRMVGVQRDDDTPQHKAVREAFTNAIIHADMMMDAGVLRIEKHDDKLVFRNPGLLRIPVEQIYEGGVSYARNPKIQNMLRMVGYGENLGSGFPLILDAWKQAGWGKPELINKIELDEVELDLPIMKLVENPKDIAEENKREMSDVLKTVLKDVHNDVLKELTERQAAVLEILCVSPDVTQQEMSTKLKVSKKTIQREFDAIRKLGISIDRQDGRKEGEWIIKV